MQVEQDYDYFIVLDFEATCDSPRKMPFSEIIEFPSVVVSSLSKKAEFEFHQYVKPTKYRELTSFCNELTGIKQEWVDNAKFFPEVLKDYELWLNETKLLKNQRIIWVTCGDWDLKTMLPEQCQRENIEIPHWVGKFGFLNIKRSFCDHFKQEARGMKNMLDVLEIQLEGRHHSGIDDCRNTAKILIKMLEEGYKVTKNIQDVSITGRYISTGVNMGFLCLSLWFPNHSQLQKYSETYGRPTMIVTAMNKREGGRKVNKFMKKYGKNNNIIEHIALKYPGSNILQVKERIELQNDLRRVIDHLKYSTENKVIITCSNGWNKSPIISYLILRLLGRSGEESINIMKCSRYRSVEKFSEVVRRDCEEFIHQMTKNE